MSHGASLNKQSLIGVFLAIGAGLIAVDMFAVPKPDGSFIITLTFWTMLVQGCVAVAAAAEVSKGLWIRPIQRDLLSVYPMLLFLAVLSLAMWVKVEVYNWIDHPTVWLEARFFVIRNFVLVLLSWFVARMLAKAKASGSDKASTIAGWYVFIWVVSQTLVAFDWIMSLAYPWISTLFGGFFFIQSLLMGLLCASFIIWYRTRRGGETGLTETLRDVGKMTFSFCFMWGGFMFAQYLVIWYGNIPEEVSYILTRTRDDYWLMSRLVLFMIFILPFLTLVFRKVKTIPEFMIFISGVVFAGIVLELLLMVRPEVPVNSVWMLVELAMLDALFVLMWLNRNAYMPQLVTDPRGDKTGGGAADLAQARPH